MGKLMLAVAAVLVATAAASVFRIQTKHTPLQQKLEKIITLVPFDKVAGIVAGYIDSKDPEVLEVVDYVASGKLINLIEIIVNMPKVQDQVHELEIKGIHVEETLTFVKGLILDKLPGKVEKLDTKFKGLMGLYTQILSVLPISQILGDVIMLTITNEEVQIILHQVRSKDCFEAAHEVLTRKDVSEDLERLRRAGLDVDGFIETVESLIGWSSYQRDLKNKMVL